jgi:cyclic pyranopterin monophosphate synthase
MSDHGSGLTHVDAEGRPRMVNVTEKDHTERLALAEGQIRMSREAFDAIRSGTTPKGDVLQVAQIAAITGGKRTSDLIPLCHALPGVSLTVDVEPDPDLPGVRIQAEARVSGQTGVEMEAITAVSIGLVTVYDMVKAVDRGMVISGIRLLSKAGGKSGSWSAEGG